MPFIKRSGFGKLKYGDDGKDALNNCQEDQRLGQFCVILLQPLAHCAVQRDISFDVGEFARTLLVARKVALFLFSLFLLELDHRA